MKKFGLILCACLIIVCAIFGFRYGPLLKQEDATLRLVMAISMLDLTSRGHVEYEDTEYVKRYVSIQNEENFRHVKKMLSDFGWTYKEREKSALYFHNGKETVVVETGSFNGDYFLWDIPLEVFD